MRGTQTLLNFFYEYLYDLSDKMYQVLSVVRISIKKNHGDVHSATIVFQQEYLLQTALTLICC